MIKKAKLKPSKDNLEINDYTQTLIEIKNKIQEAQVKAIIAVNTELLKLYWTIGKIIVVQQEKNAWGTNVIEKLAQDLQNLFPGLGGFSRANVFRMRGFYLAYEKVAQAVRQLEDLPIFNIPWSHNIILLQKIKSNQERLWYAQKAIEYGWSRSMLETWIKSKLFHREGKAITNFQKTLLSPQSDMAQQSLKDPYLFDFLTLHEQHLEHDLEQGLIENVEKLLLEMGKGFALVGRQYHLEIGEVDYYVDLLFYHLNLKCFVVVELKARKFDPRDIGQLNFYLSVVDDLLRRPSDEPTIGLLLCKTKNNFTAEYALSGINKPIGVAEYETAIFKKLSKELKSNLPSIEEIEAELEKKEILEKDIKK